MNLDLPGPPEWHERAACAGHAEPDLWFSDRSHEAKLICRHCPVAAQCLNAAMTAPEWGIWAGTTEDERRAAQGKKRRAG